VIWQRHWPNLKDELQVNDVVDSPRIVLVRPSHPGNIGAVARAMGNMGFHRLCLVSPKEFPSPVATSRAASATQILDGAEVYDSLDDAIHDCRLVVGTTARVRTIDWPTQTPRQAVAALTGAPGECALVFGNERNGLSNSEVDRCHQLVRIPVDESCPSLNLAAAVMILTYEYRIAAQAGPEQPLLARATAPSSCAKSYGCSIERKLPRKR